MPSFSVLNAIAEELREQIIAALISAPDIDLTVDKTTVTLASPASDLADDVVACLYLYHVDIDPHLRNRRHIPDAADPTLMVKPPLPLQLRFLFTPVAEEEESNQLLLGRVLQHFHDAPTFRPAPTSLLGQSRGGAPEKLRVRYDFPSVQDFATLWSGFSDSLRLSAGLLVEIVTLDSAAPALSVPRVGEVFGAGRLKEVEETP